MKESKLIELVEFVRYFLLSIYLSAKQLSLSIIKIVFSNKPNNKIETLEKYAVNRFSFNYFVVM